MRSNRFYDFWCRPAGARSLAAFRISLGLLLLYSHWIWCSAEELNTFSDYLPIVEPSLRHAGLFLYQKLEGAIGAVAVSRLAIVSFSFMTAGLCSRVSTVTSLFFLLAFSGRFADFGFGFDDVLIPFCAYLCLANAGDRFSLDAWLRPVGDRQTSRNQIALRLLQLHLCVIYASSGFAKLAGESWRDGTALWRIIASPEFQTLDLTWMAAFPLLIKLGTWFVLAWECLYALLVWPRATRYGVVAGAAITHLAIGLAMGMAPFGLLMLAANLAAFGAAPELILLRRKNENVSTGDGLVSFIQRLG